MVQACAHRHGDHRAGRSRGGHRALRGVRPSSSRRCRREAHVGREDRATRPEGQRRYGHLQSRPRRDPEIGRVGTLRADGGGGPGAAGYDPRAHRGARAGDRRAAREWKARVGGYRGARSRRVPRRAWGDGSASAGRIRGRRHDGPSHGREPGSHRGLREDPRGACAR